jgi:hypothetical protein
MRWAVIASLMLVLALAPSAHAQPPRTPDGKPDLQGVWYAATLTRLERPDGVSGLVIPPEKAGEAIKALTRSPKGVYDPDIDYFRPSQLLSINGELRSSWLTEPADGKMPYTQLAAASLDLVSELESYGFDNPEERAPWERCIAGMGHPPLSANSYVIPHMIVQTPDAIIIATEDTDSGRIIHLTGAAPAAVMRSRAGWSAGRWDGDTLVVTTTNVAVSGPTGVNYRGELPVSEDSVTTERFTLTSADEILYQFTIADRLLFKAAWSAEYILKRHPGEFHEYACHEGNYAMTNALQAARLGRQSTKAADEKKKAPPTP